MLHSDAISDRPWSRLIYHHHDRSYGMGLSADGIADQNFFGQFGPGCMRTAAFCAQKTDLPKLVTSADSTDWSEIQLLM